MTRAAPPICAGRWLMLIGNAMMQIRSVCACGSRCGLRSPDHGDQLVAAVAVLPRELDELNAALRVPATHDATVVMAAIWLRGCRHGGARSLNRGGREHQRCR